MSIWPIVEESGFDLFFGLHGLFSIRVFAQEVMPSDQILRGRVLKLYMPSNRDKHGRWCYGEDVSVSFGPKEMEIL